ncbi:class I adenylate-forming enzyme family protein [Streptomyces sp. NBC_01089]|uniref:class I adenylate-forming enzyme family protein n=1 Tax=Streptomyces sp. NBC_01089 TaxID=2903747 RepID=UPI00386E2247|nr:acyl--CoA ligase [Streptomyces sp. NBC_01089]
MLGELFTATLRRHADRVAVADSLTSVTYTQLDGRARVAEEAVRPFGAERGTHVGIRASNSVSYVTVYCALLRAGCVPFLIDASLGSSEISMIIKDCALELILTDGDLDLPDGEAIRVGSVEHLQVHRLIRTTPRPELLDSTAVCRFTSGSTGRPTCIEFSATAVENAARNWAEGTGLGADDGIACFAALSNGLAFNTSLLAAFLVGARLHLSQGLPTAGRVRRLVDDTGATRLVAFPALYESVARHRGSGPDAGADLARAFRRVKVAISSAAPLRPEIRARFTELTGVPVSDYYGTAETGPLTYSVTDRTGGALGEPLPGVQVRAGTSADAPGPITVRSASMGSRYLNENDQFAARIDADGFYRTGDSGYLGEHGLVLVGRTNRMINVAGRKIDPLEVAAVLQEFPGVRDAFVLEAPDRRGDPALAAVFVGDAGVTSADLRHHVAARLARYKVPALLRAVPAVPRGSTGKPSLTGVLDLLAHKESAH